MPLYSYRCKCKHEFDHIASIADRQSVLCPKCGELAENIGVYKVYMKTDVKGPGAAWIRNDKESPTAVLKEDHDPPVESRKDMEDMIKRKGVVPLG